MAKQIMEMDTFEDRTEITLINNRWKMYDMLNDISNYIRHLNKYEERTEIPVQEIIERLNNATSEFYIVEEGIE